MANKILLLLFGIMFVFGWFCSSAYSSVLSQISLINPGNLGNIQVADPDASFIDRYFFKNKELISPSDWVKQQQIHLFDNKVVIDIEDPQWAIFTDTNSMDPVIDAGAHAIEIVPESPEQISVGDIVSYKSEYADGNVIHRVVYIDNDDEGWYCRMKGDNNPFEDPGKIRFEQIQRVLVAVIY
jgi:hypothetical protein